MRIVTASTNTLLRAAIGVLVIVLMAVVYNAVHEPVVNSGDPAPHFAVTADSGRALTEKDFGGKLLLVNFWASWCQPCVEETPSLDLLQRRLGPNGLVVLGISVDKDAKAYQRFLAQQQVSFLTARDGEQKINAEYGTYQYPESYLIDTSGKVVEKIIGPRDWSDPALVTHVQSLL
jgi:cytochrome c biogenesis protein CcmG, thiol:disulfide interchange protein DsbE